MLLSMAFVNTALAQKWTPSSPENGGTYYLYNVGKRGFLVGNNNRPTTGPVPLQPVILQYSADGSTGNGDAFKIDTHLLRNNGGADQWMVENWDDDYIYIDVNNDHNMHFPWRFEPVEDATGVYHIVITGGTDEGRRLEMDSRNNGVRNLDDRLAAQYARSTRESSAGGNLVGKNDQWMLVTPEDYQASIAGHTDYTNKVGKAQADWLGASEFGTAVTVTTADGVTTGIPAFYGSSEAGEKISQTVAGLDNGIYEVRLFAHSHNERADHGTSAPGTAVTGYPEAAYVFAESGDSHVQTYIDARGRDPLGWTKAEFYTPYTLSDVVVKNGQIKMGLGLSVNNTTQWQAIQIYSLVRTGDLPQDEVIEGEEIRLAEAIARAKAMAENALPLAMKEALNGTETTYVASEIESSGTQEEILAKFSEANEAINALISDAETLLVPFACYRQVYLGVEAIKAQTSVYTDEGGVQTGILDAAVATANEAANASLTSEAIDAARASIVGAVGVFIKATNTPGQYFDLTSLLINPGFEMSRDTGWSYSHNGGGFNYMTRDTFHCVEFFNCTYDLHQTLGNMPGGYYKVSVNGHYRPNNENYPAEHIQENVDGYLYITGGTPVALQVLRNNVTSITTIHNQMDNGEYLNTAKSYVADDNSSISIGVKCETQRREFSWTLIDDFKLYYSVEDIDVYLEPYNEALANAQAVDTDQPMNALEKADLLEAITADETLDKTNVAAIEDATATLQTRTQAALSSIAAYAEAYNALQRIRMEMDNTNLVTPEALALFEGYFTAYENGTFTDDEASGLMRRTFRDGVNREPANTIDEYLLSAWKEGETQMQNYDGKIYINTWSTEADVPGFERPFYEFADGWPGSTAAHTFTASLDNLEPGVYKVDIWVRTQLNGNNAGVPEGITLQLNDGRKVDVRGEASGNFRSGLYSVYGNVATDGALTFKLDIASASYGTWLSFKNVHYSKVEDLAAVTIDENITYTPEAKVADVTLIRTFNPNAWNTLVLPFEVNDVKEVFGADTQVKKYTGATETDDLYTLNFEDIDYIPANTPVFIYGVNNASPYLFDFASIEEGEPVAADANISFVGSYADRITLEPGSFFIASDNNLYKVGETSTVTLRGTRGYFKPAEGVEVKRLGMSVDGEATSINILEEGISTSDGEIYNISGQRLSKPQKGINIVNGKKIFIK